MSARLATTVAMPSASRSLRVAATTTWIRGTLTLGSDSVNRFIRQRAVIADSSRRIRKGLDRPDPAINPLGNVQIHPKIAIYQSEDPLNRRSRVEIGDA